MISDSIYELQFIQMFSVFKFVQYTKYNIILLNFLNSFYKYSFLDLFLNTESLFLNSNKLSKVSLGKKYGIFRELTLFFILIILGIFFIILIGIIRFCKLDIDKDIIETEKKEVELKMEQAESENSENKVNSEINDLEKSVIKKKENIKDLKKKEFINSPNFINKKYSQKNISDISSQKLISENFQSPKKNVIKKFLENSKDKGPNKNSKGLDYLLTKNYYFQRCSYTSIRSYFFFSYFIRVHQFTIIKVMINISFILLLKESLPQIFDYYLAIFILSVWVIILPLVVLTYLRNNQIDLMSEKQLIRFGSLYLNYRGIAKDYYAVIMQVKFIAIPFICIKFTDLGEFLFVICGIIYLYYIFFVTISQPFSKVWKVLNESLSFLVMIIFSFFHILIVQLDSNYKNKTYSDYISLCLIIGLFFIRGFRICIDTTKRIFEVKKMRMPKQTDFTSGQDDFNSKNKNINSNDKSLIELQILNENEKENENDSEFDIDNHDYEENKSEAEENKEVMKISEKNLKEKNFNKINFDEIKSQKNKDQDISRINEVDKIQEVYNYCVEDVEKKNTQNVSQIIKSKGNLSSKNYSIHQDNEYTDKSNSSNSSNSNNSSNSSNENIEKSGSGYNENSMNSSNLKKKTEELYNIKEESAYHVNESSRISDVVSVNASSRSDFSQKYLRESEKTENNINDEYIKSISNKRNSSFKVSKDEILKSEIKVLEKSEIIEVVSPIKSKKKKNFKNLLNN